MRKISRFASNNSKELFKKMRLQEKEYRDKKWFEKTIFYITNTDLSGYRLSKIIRGHRKIENRGGAAPRIALDKRCNDERR